MGATEPTRNPVDLIAEAYIQRRRAGDDPSMDEYVAQHPEHAEEIRKIFPALEMIEQARDVMVDRTDDASMAANLVLGDRMGDFQLLREVGRGGMGVVYEAQQSSLGRRVALKVLAPQYIKSAGTVERFKREARAAASLQHSHIVPVFGVGENAGFHYYVMQYIHGRGMDEIMAVLRQEAPANDLSENESHSAEELAMVLESGPVRSDKPDRLGAAAESTKTSRRSGGRSSGSPAKSYFERIAEIGAHVADALAYAHRHGILHRDVKPSNLLYDVTGNIWVADFGLAKIEGDNDLTASGDVVGTLRYLAPEALRGKVDERSDVYSLGLTLHELLSLRKAFDSSDRGELVRKITVEGPPRFDRRSGIPADLETIIYKAIERSPKDRYVSAEQLAEDLQRFLRHEPVLARRVSPVGRLIRWSKRNRAFAAVSVLLLASLLLGFAASLVVSARLLHLTQQLSTSLDVSRHNEYTAEINVAGHTITQIGELTVGLEILNRLRPKLAQPDFRGWEWRYLRGLCRSDSQQCLFNAGSAVYGLDLTNDDRYLAVAARQSLQLWDLSTQKRLGVINDTKAFFGDPAFSPDGRHVFAALENRSVGVYSVPALEKVSDLGLNEEFIADIQFSPDGKLVAVVGARNAYLFSLSGTELLARWPCRCYTSFTGNAAFTSDGKLLIIFDNEALVAYSTAELLANSAQRAPPSSVYRIDTQRTCMETLLSQDGSSLLCAVGRGIEIRDPFRGDLLGRLTGHASIVRAICQTSSGNIFSAATDNTTRIWRLEENQDALILLRDMDETMAVVGMHQNSRLISGGISGEIRLWETDPQLLASWPKSKQVFPSIDVESHSTPAICDDGQRIIHVTQPAPSGDTGLTNRVQLDHLQYPKESRTLVLDPFQNLYTSVVTLPGSERIAVGTRSGEVIVWNLKNNQEETRFQAHELRPETVDTLTSIESGTLVSAVLPRHRILVTRQNAEPVNHGRPNASCVRFWSLDTWRESTSLEPPRIADGIYSIQFSADETHCAVKPCNAERVDIWNLLEGSLVRSVKGIGASFCPTEPNEYVVYQYGGQIDFYRLDREIAIGSMRAHGDHLNSVIYLSDGQRLATASDEDETSVRIWDVRTRRLLLTLTGVGKRPTLQASSRGNLVLAQSHGPRGGFINVWRAMSDLQHPRLLPLDHLQ